jgi:integrase
MPKSSKAKSRLQTRAARAALPVRKKPYWERVAPGAHLGYRRNQGPGSWCCRYQGRIKRLGDADDSTTAAPPAVLDFWQAQDEARKIALGDAPSDDRSMTIKEAFAKYEDDLRARMAITYNARWPLRYMSDKMLRRPVHTFTAAEWKDWRNSLLPQFETRRASLNRLLKCVRAGLKLAAGDNLSLQTRIREGLGLVVGKTSRDKARDTDLNDDQVRAIVAAAHAHDQALGLFVEVLAVTGARPSQAARLICDDLLINNSQKPCLDMPLSGKGGGRNRAENKSVRSPLPITPELGQRLKAAVAGRSRNDRLLLQSSGKNWNEGPTSMPYRYAIRTVLENVGLDPDVVTLYWLRHASIVRQLTAHHPIHLVAEHHNTSEQMIRHYYARAIVKHSDELSRRVMLQDSPAANNVVALPKKARSNNQ